jgi:hypothetical protein
MSGCWKEGRPGARLLGVFAKTIDSRGTEGNVFQDRRILVGSHCSRDMGQFLTTQSNQARELASDAAALLRSLAEVNQVRGESWLLRYRRG